ncbi:MAG: hypothetical protein N2202_03285 [Proteobacteria bacterium]|nr:hypothetical protein [Pseudomonadota bacterium]
MDKKKKILLSLVGLWILIFIIIKYNGNIMRGNQSSLTKEKPINFTAKEKGVDIRNVRYPENSLKITNKDLFGELVRPDLEQKKLEEERKKVVTIQAPPLPPLPVDPKPKVIEKEPVIDELKDISLMGILKKENKEFAFFKKDRDIRSFKRGDKIFNTNYIVTSIEQNDVILVDDKGTKRILTVEKEVKDAKKR